MLTDSIRAIYKTNLGVRKGERVLIFTDIISSAELMDSMERCRRERLRDIALLAAEIGKSFTEKISYHDYTATGSHGAEPHEELWGIAFGEKALKELKKHMLLKPLLKKEINDEGIKKAETIISRHKKSAANAAIALSNYSTSHTRFRDFLTRVCGCRYASMPLFDAFMLEGAMNVDWKGLAKRTAAIARVVNRAEAIEIKTPNGTHLTMSKHGRKALADTGILTRQGSFGNLPAGEVYMAPLEGTAKGELILEWAPTRELKSPIKLTVKNGLVAVIEGDEPYKDVLRSKINERKENANIAELGIGTNNKAKRPDNILESEKILGTIHVALGDNSSFGGNVRTPFHQDFVFFKPTLTLISKDGEKTVLMRDGKFTAIT